MNISEKISILEKNGYKYIFDRDVFCNYKQRKCFSLEFIEDKSIDVIQSKLKEPAKKTITFYFNTPPSRSVRTLLEKEIKGIFLEHRDIA
jgi:hypothetical protein